MVERESGGEAARKAEGRMKLRRLLLYLLSGKHWAYASSFPAPGPQYVPCTVVGEAEEEQNRRRTATSGATNS